MRRKVMFSKRDLWRIFICMVVITIVCTSISAFVAYNLGRKEGRKNYWGVPGGLSNMEESVRHRMYPLSTNYVWLVRGGDQRIILVVSGIAEWIRKYSKYVIIKEGSYLVPLIPRIQDKTSHCFKFK